MSTKGSVFTPDVFAARRDRLYERLENAVLVLPAAPTLVRSGGGEVRYRPDPELFYLTGCTDSEIVAVLQGGCEQRFVLFVPEADPTLALWTGERMGPDEAKEVLGADQALPLSLLEKELPGLLRPHRTAAYRLGSHARVDSVVREALTWSRARGARKGDGVRIVADPGEFLDDLRIRKGPEEVDVIRRATTLTVAAFKEAMALAGPGVGEWEIEAALESAIRRAGGTGPSFPTIVGSGRNACVLHYVDNSDRIEGGSMILLDGGAEVDMYLGDVTRTFSASGSPDVRQREVHAIVQEAHEAAIRSCLPGAQISEVHDTARGVLARGLAALGIIQGDPDDEEGQAILGRLFPHRTSHWLGLDVHDVGAYEGPGGATVLEAGMVLTVEPGLYFSPGLEGIPEEYAGLGVRIEDDVLITAEGAENLTSALPTGPEGMTG